MGRIGDRLGADFVISTGDNFYEDGLEGVDDPAFFESFSHLYTAPSLQTPWYTGEHDHTLSLSLSLSLSLNISIRQRGAGI